MKDFTIDRNQEKIRSVRVVLPNKSMKYEYQRDVDGILKKICQAAPSEEREGAHPRPAFRGFCAISSGSR